MQPRQPAWPHGPNGNSHDKQRADDRRTLAQDLCRQEPAPSGGDCCCRSPTLSGAETSARTTRVTCSETTTLRARCDGDPSELSSGRHHVGSWFSSMNQARAPFDARLRASRLGRGSRSVRCCSASGSAGATSRGRPRGGSGARPRTRSPGQRRQPRRGQSCARTRSAEPCGPARRPP